MKIRFDNVRECDYILDVQKVSASVLFAAVCWAQDSIPSAPMPEWQRAAGSKMAFEAASVKLVVDGSYRSAGYSLDTGNSYRSTGGRFSAVFPLISYIVFAYKVMLTSEQRKEILARLPKWISTDFYEIQARAPIMNPSKDQMRLMVRSLLAERFGLALHFERRSAPVLALVLPKSGKLGSHIRPHDDGTPCPDTSNPADVARIAKIVFPVFCESFQAEPQPNGNLRLGARNGTMDHLASMIPFMAGTEISKTVVDRTSLEGKFDFTIEFTPETPERPATNSQAQEAQPQMLGSTFLEALHDQLGLKLEPTKANIHTPLLTMLNGPRRIDYGFPPASA